MKWACVLAVLLMSIDHDSEAAFSSAFTAFITEEYGNDAAQLLIRSDFGNQGSFGGDMQKNSSEPSIPVKRRPVIIVHGVTNMAMKFGFVRDFLLKNNYTEDEIYATTYGHGPHRFIVFVKMECQYIKQIRAFITSVSSFTESKVDVLAYSMGSPIARKALLGGDCESEYLGPPITDLVETFIGVAGANYGSYLCFIPIGICNSDNGLSCDSRLLHDLNTQSRKYEGSYTFAIFSRSDNKVGMSCCGRNCSSIPHSDGEYIFDGMDHDQIMHETLGLQLELLNRGYSIGR